MKRPLNFKKIYIVVCLMHVNIQCAFGKIIIVDSLETSKWEANQKYVIIILMTHDVKYNFSIEVGWICHNPSSLG